MMFSPSTDDLQVVPATPYIQNESKSCALVPSLPNGAVESEVSVDNSLLISHPTIDRHSNSPVNRLSLQPSLLNLHYIQDESTPTLKNKEDQMVPECSNDSIWMGCESQMHSIPPNGQTSIFSIKGVSHPNDEQNTFANTTSIIQTKLFSSTDFSCTKQESHSPLYASNNSGLFSCNVGSVMHSPQNNLKHVDPQLPGCTTNTYLTDAKQTDRTRNMRSIKISYNKNNLQPTSKGVIQRAIPKIRMKDSINNYEQGRAAVQLQRNITVLKPLSDQVPQLDFFDSSLFL